jgi:carbon monoxide dehydrogenase subunit G
MTVLRNTIHIEAPPKRVWAVLARLDALHEYDPGISKSEILSKHEGIGTVLDALLVRRKWDAGVKSFFSGLKRYVEARAAE